MSQLVRKLMMPTHGNSGLAGGRKASRPNANMRPGPGEEGLGARHESDRILDRLLVPRDSRGIVLACGFASLAILGFSALIGGDSIGYAYLVAAGAGYFFLQTRLFPVAIWLLVAAGGALVATAGNPTGWIIAAVALTLAGIGLLPVSGRETSRKPEVRRSDKPSSIQSQGPPVAETSRNHEVSSQEVAEARALVETPNAEPGLPNGGFKPTPIHVTRVTRTIGRLTLEVDGRDVSKRLREQPRIEFLLSFLLARAVLGMGPIDRSALAEEVAPGIPASNQRERLRKQLPLLQTAIGSGFNGVVNANNAQVSLDLSTTEVDAIVLKDVRARLLRRPGLLDAALADLVRKQLEATAGEFMSDFAELEQQVTSGRGTAGELVSATRKAITDWRADLTQALAEYLRASDQSQHAIAYLKSALSQSPEREDLARLLVAAYLETGQTARAEEVRGEYELGKGGVR